MIDEQKLEKLAFLMHQASVENFTGDITVRYYRGGITRVKKDTSTELNLTS